MRRKLKTEGVCRSPNSEGGTLAALTLPQGITVSFGHSIETTA